MAQTKLASGRNPNWDWMDRFEVPQYEGDGVYLTRWRVIVTPLFSLLVHRFTGPDPRATLHDHPWNFLSIVLRGGYIERRLNPVTMEVDEDHEVHRLNLVRAGDCHAIVELLAPVTWTLLLTGRRRRTWGYLEPRAEVQDGELRHGWLWTAFDRHRHADSFAAALARRQKRAW